MSHRVYESVQIRECYEKKFYFNVLIDDKAAFDPESDWEPLYHLLMKYKEENFVADPSWTTKY